jgi:hypothetical protein
VPRALAVLADAPPPARTKPRGTGRWPARAGSEVPPSPLPLLVSSPWPPLGTIAASARLRPLDYTPMVRGKTRVSLSPEWAHTSRLHNQSRWRGRDATRLLQTALFSLHHKRLPTAHKSNNARTGTPRLSLSEWWGLVKLSRHRCAHSPLLSLYPLPLSCSSSSSLFSPAVASQASLLFDSIALRRGSGASLFLACPSERYCPVTGSK